MNNIVLMSTGGVKINGTDVKQVSGIRIKLDGNCTTATIQFDVASFDVEVSAEDFRLNNLPLTATKKPESL